MRNRTIISLVLLVLSATVFVRAQTASDLLLRGAALKQTGNCEAAIPIFERIVREFPFNKNREDVAMAKLNLGDCWLKKTAADRDKGLNYLNDVTAHYKELTDIVREANRLKRLSMLADPGQPLKIVTPFTEDAFSFAISPDGRNVVVQATTADGKQQLWMHAVDASRKPVAIAGTDGAGSNAFPFFSPDGKSIGFFADRKLRRVSASGGIPKDLTPPLQSFRGGTWNRDGVIVYSDGREVLHRIQDDGSGLTEVTSGPGFSQVLPRFLSDGFRFMFMVGPGRVLSLGATDHSAPSVLRLIDAEAAAFAPPDRLVYVAGGALMAQRLDARNENMIGDSIQLAERVALGGWDGVAALSVSEAGPIAYRTDAFAPRQFRLVDRKGGLIRNVGHVDYSGQSRARISRDGKTVMFHRWRESIAFGSMWTMDIGDGTPVRLRIRASSAVWSRNTEHMMFAEQAGDGPQMDLYDRMDIFMEAKNIVTVGDQLRVDDWSSKNVVLYERIPGSIRPADLMALPPGGGPPVAIAAAITAGERNGRFSPDGDWIAYQSDELESRDEIFVQRFPGSTKVRTQVSINGGTLPHWSADGLQLYFKSTDNHLMSVSMTPSADGQNIVPGKALPLFTLKPGSEFEVAADDRFLINDTTERDAPPILVLRNWANRLPAITANATSSPLVVPSTGRPKKYGEQTQIVVVDRRGKILNTVKDTGSVAMFSLSPDGSRVVFFRGKDIYVHDITTDKEVQVASNVLTDAGPPEWSSDGARMAYRASRNGTQELYEKSSDGTGNEKLLYAPVSSVFNWSKDDRFIAIKTGSNYAVLPLYGEPKPITIMPTAGITGLRLAPDGRMVTYLSDASRRNEVYVRSFDPTGATSLGAAVPRKVSTHGSPGLMRFRSDGKEMYYLSSEGGVMVVSDVNAAAFDEQSATRLFQVPDNFPLASTPGPGVYADISADGQRFVFAVPAPTTAGK